MPDDWTSDSLKSLCLFVRDGTHGTHKRFTSGIPLLSAKNVGEDGNLKWNDSDSFISESDFKKIQKEYVISPGDLLLTIVGTLGRCALVLTADAISVQRSVAILRVNPEKIGPSFLLHCLRSDEFQRALVCSSNATAQAGVYLGELENLHVLHPRNKAEQLAIAELLATMDAVIQQTEALIAKLKLIKTGLLHDLLTCGLDENGQLREPLAHPEQFKDSPLGRIPQEWDDVEIGAVRTAVTSGSRGWARFYSEDGPLFLRIGNLTREHVNLCLDDVVHVNPPPGTEGSRTQVQEGDILISITADLGIIGVIPPDFGEAYINQHIALVRLDQGRANPRFVGNNLASEVAQKQFYRLNDVGAKAGLNLPVVESLRIALPDPNEQEAIAVRIDAQDARIRMEQDSLQKLRLLKRGLMADLLTGRVKVPPPPEEST